MAARAPAIDHYAVLQLSPSADEDSIKANYRRLALVKHPDRNGNTAKANADFQELQEAYESLLDSTKRRLFDCTYTPGRPVDASNVPDPRRNRRHVEPAEYYHQLITLTQELVHLEQQREKLGKEQVESRQAMDEKQEALARLQAEDHRAAAQAEAEDAARNTWLGFFFRHQLSAAEREERDRQADGRRTSRLVLESELDRCKGNLGSITSQLEHVERLISITLKNRVAFRQQDVIAIIREVDDLYRQGHWKETDHQQNFGYQQEEQSQNGAESPQAYEEARWWHHEDATSSCGAEATDESRSYTSSSNLSSHSSYKHGEL
ncbi:hypothetical protein QQS21_003108 [Conoideocrella luteorostrata]|uniref:J domain-containing protein n=1 Tax=Conoideocrella luteorostrata TaxID=1105319 RepID=A0AAJ0CTR6_9HYPO|nr:hypothetical protein QQS21_003108 [Conoideocrella luteorostrata]